MTTINLQEEIETNLDKYFERVKEFQELGEDDKAFAKAMMIAKNSTDIPIYDIYTRRIYKEFFNPQGKNVVIYDGKGKYNGWTGEHQRKFPEEYNGLERALKVQGVQSIAVDDGRKNEPTEEQWKNADQIIYRSIKICEDGTGNSIMFGRFKNLEGSGLLFLVDHNILEECRSDWEIEEARKLNREGKKVNIIYLHRQFAGTFPQKYL
jgi:hypothetical protein